MWSKLSLQCGQPDSTAAAVTGVGLKQVVSHRHLLLSCVPSAAGKSSLYDNPAMKRAPRAAQKGKSNMDPEEDIYGGLGEGGGGIYDDTTGVGAGMKHSEEGIYDNPHTKGKRRDSLHTR